MSRTQLTKETFKTKQLEINTNPPKTFSINNLKDFFEISRFTWVGKLTLSKHTNYLWQEFMIARKVSETEQKRHKWDYLGTDEKHLTPNETIPLNELPPVVKEFIETAKPEIKPKRKRRTKQEMLEAKENL